MSVEEGRSRGWMSASGELGDALTSSRAEVHAASLTHWKVAVCLDMHTDIHTQAFPFTQHRIAKLCTYKDISMQENGHAMHKNQHTLYTNRINMVHAKINPYVRTHTRTQVLPMALKRAELMIGWQASWGLCSSCDGGREEPIRGSRRGPGTRLIRFAKMAVSMEVIITCKSTQQNLLHMNTPI